MTLTAKDSDVRAAIEHWAPRFVQGGVDYNDFVTTTRRISTWSEWLPEWNRTADEHVKIAREAEDSGHHLTAGHAWRRASVTRHFGKFVWTLDPDLAAEATLRSAAELQRALTHLDPTAERIETPFRAASMASTLRKPAGVAPFPIVLLIPGADSTKEEFFYFEQSFLDRGMATLSIDGPGQGETGLQIPIQPDYDAAVAVVLDQISGRADLDFGRIGLCGVSLGGFYAPRVAAFEPRLRAMAAISGPYDVSAIWPATPDISKRSFMLKAWVETEDQALRVAGELRLDGLCERITVPSLYVTGDLDRLVPWQHTERQARETPDAKFVCYPGGNHGVSNLPHIARPMIADWMHDRLRNVA